MRGGGLGVRWPLLQCFAGLARPGRAEVAELLAADTLLDGICLLELLAVTTRAPGGGRRARSCHARCATMRAPGRARLRVEAELGCAWRRPRELQAELGCAWRRHVFALLLAELGGAWRQRTAARGGGGRRHMEVADGGGSLAGAGAAGTRLVFVFLFWT
jgi:hypothetical protein